MYVFSKYNYFFQKENLLSNIFSLSLSLIQFFSLFKKKIFLVHTKTISFVYRRVIFFVHMKNVFLYTKKILFLCRKTIFLCKKKIFFRIRRVCSSCARRTQFLESIDYQLIYYHIISNMWRHILFNYIRSHNYPFSLILIIQHTDRFNVTYITMMLQLFRFIFPVM